MPQLGRKKICYEIPVKQLRDTIKSIYGWDSSFNRIINSDFTYVTGDIDDGATARVVEGKTRYWLYVLFALCRHGYIEEGYYRIVEE